MTPGRRHRRTWARWLAVLPLLVAWACGSGQPVAPLLERTAARVRLAPPAGGEYDNAAWLPDGQGLVASLTTPTVGPTGPDREWHLAAVPLDGGPPGRLPIPDDPDCRRTAQYLPRLLSDGRVAFIQRCEGGVNPERLLPEEAVRLLAYDPTSRATAPMVPYYLPFRANFFDFAPDVALGVINDGNGLYERLRWLRPDRLEIIDLPLERAGWPRWSPSGGVIALSGAAPPPGGAPSGQGRVDLARQLYLLQVGTAALEPLMSDLTWVGAPAWSPDGRWLAASLHPRRGGAGVWLIEVATRRPTRLVAGEDTGSVNWSPDGRSLAVILGGRPPDVGGAPEPSSIAIFDLPDLTGIATH